MIYIFDFLEHVTRYFGIDFIIDRWFMKFREISIHNANFASKAIKIMHQLYHFPLISQKINKITQHLLSHFIPKLRLIIYRYRQIGNKMGAEQHKFTNDTTMTPRSDNVIPVEYQICYEKWLADPNFIYNLLNENKQVTANILAFFPNARSSYEDFLQMVSYLRRYDPTIVRNQYAKYNVHQTTLLDRFFMMVLKLGRFEQLNEVRIGVDQMEDLFLELMRFFIPNPRKGFIFKLLNFIGFKDVKETTLKQYSASLREFLPHIQKHIKDYYTQKFLKMQQNGLLLQKFKSQILVEDAVLLSMKVHQLTQPDIRLLYEPRSCGTSFHSIQKGILGYTGPWLLVLEHFQKDAQGNSQLYKFGSYQSGPILDVATFQGDVRGFLFQIEPAMRLMSTDKGSGGNRYFLINNLDERTTKMHKGIGFGGNSHKQNFKLWIDQDFDKSTVFNGNDETYGFGSLVSGSITNLNITRMEIWALGRPTDIENLFQYWETRTSEIQKRRKVNKGQFVQGDAGLLFEKTFEHREQVYGVIEKGKQQQHQAEQVPRKYSEQKQAPQQQPLYQQQYTEQQQQQYVQQQQYTQQQQYPQQYQQQQQPQQQYPPQ